MFSTANTYTLTLPNNETIAFGPNDSVTNWVALIASNGITSNVELRESRSAITRNDGEIIGTSYWGNRSIVIDLFLPQNNPATRADAITKLQRCSTMIRQQGQLSWTEQDTGGTAKQVPVYLQSFPTLTHGDGPTKTYQIVLTAAQPHIDKGGTASSLSNGARNTDIVVSNGGDWDAYPVYTITGPTSAGAYIKNKTTNETITFTTALLSTEQVTVYTNPNNRQVLKANISTPTTTTNFYGSVQLGSDFPKLQAGNNTIYYASGAAGTTGSTISASWRGAFM